MHTLNRANTASKLNRIESIAVLKRFNSACIHRGYDGTIRKSSYVWNCVEFGVITESYTDDSEYSVSLSGHKQITCKGKKFVYLFL